VRYLSTRGEASTLSFTDALLAGLARDGGLYVPQSYPSLDAATIAGFAGRPYAQVAQEFGLAASRGSDFHSPHESRIDLGLLPDLPKGLKPVWELVEHRIQ
jgi:hypothetical protein